MTVERAQGDRSGRPRSGRSGPVRLRVQRMHREAKRPGPIDVMEEVRWTLAEEYAAAVDLAKLQQNARDLMSALKALETLLGQLAPAAPTPPEGGPSGDSGDGSSAELYGRPPTVGDAPHA